MSQDASDLSGEWHGIFNYPLHQPPGEFEAVLREISGILSGETSEMGQCPEDCHLTVTAAIEGERNGNRVTFVKFYDSDLPDYLPVQYAGSVSPDGDEIAGNWTIPGEWSGTFIMVRNVPVASELEAEAEETVR